MMCASDHLVFEAEAEQKPGVDWLGVGRVAMLGFVERFTRPVIALDARSFQLTFANASARNFFSLAESGGVGRPVSDVLSKDWAEYIRRQAELVASTGDRHVHEAEMPHPVFRGASLFRLEWVPLASAPEGIRPEVGVMVEDLAETKQSREYYAMAKVEAERNRISTELHDSLAHSLNGLLWQLRSLMFEMNEDKSLAKYVSSLEVAESLGRDLHREFRRAVWALGSDVLRDRSLPEALESELRKVTEIAGIGSTFTLRGEPCEIADENEQAAAKIFQEAVHNVIKHASCTNIRVELAYDMECLKLVVEDDGKGFDIEHPGIGAGFGLKNMQSRAEGIAGSVSIDSHPGHGTKVTVTVPAGKTPHDR